MTPDRRITGPTPTSDGSYTRYRAEALLHTGDLAGAAEPINITRTRPQTIGGTEYAGLPPVTAAGVPEVDGVCVPRPDSGACGRRPRYPEHRRLRAGDVAVSRRA